jgi:nitroreductase
MRGFSMFDYPKTLNTADGAPLDLVLSRRSGSAKTMTGPGPDATQLRQILAAGVRVPDHGKLAPWRFILFEGEGRNRMGALLAEAIGQEKEGAADRAALEKERFLRAPVIVAVVSRTRDQINIPVWEQQLSAGAVCQNILVAAHAIGFVANWITEWPAYHPLVAERLGLKPGERIAGFIYIGQPAVPLEDRPRPDIDALTTRF